MVFISPKTFKLRDEIEKHLPDYIPEHTGEYGVFDLDDNGNLTAEFHKTKPEKGFYRRIPTHVNTSGRLLVSIEEIVDTCPFDNKTKLLISMVRKNKIEKSDKTKEISYTATGKCPECNVHVAGLASPEMIHHYEQSQKIFYTATTQMLE